MFPWKYIPERGSGGTFESWVSVEAELPRITADLSAFLVVGITEIEEDNIRFVCVILLNLCVRANSSCICHNWHQMRNIFKSSNYLSYKVK